MKNILDIMNYINKNDLETFISNTDSKFLMKTKSIETKIDYSCIDVLEDTLPNIEKIVRNPKRFLEQEEDVLIVEKTKKISKETITHLASHSQNINDVDDEGNVRPKKLLNVYREDTTDLYENRFIYTLVSRLEEFIDRQLKYIEVISKKEINSDITYSAKTKMKNRLVDVELKMKDHNELEIYEDMKDLKTRLLSCYDIIVGFKSSQMIKELAGCSLVKTPIRKTNLILREPNFQKANILWEYLDNFEFKEPKITNIEEKINDDQSIKDEFDLSLFIEANALVENQERFMTYRDFNSKLRKLLEEYVYEEENSVESFSNLSKEFYKEALKEKEEKENNLTKLYNDFINKHMNNLNKLNDLFN